MKYLDSFEKLRLNKNYGRRLFGKRNKATFRLKEAEKKELYLEINNYITDYI